MQLTKHSNMNMNRFWFRRWPLGALLMFAVMALSSCHKHEDTAAGEVTIEIKSPREGQQFHQSEQVAIDAIISSKETLHGWAVEIRRKSDGTVLFAKDDHDHKRSYTISLTWQNNLTEHTDLILEVFAQIDHDGKKVSKKVAFHAHP